MVSEKTTPVAVVMGSDSDYKVMKNCVEQLGDFGIEPVVRIISAHRTPEIAAEFAENAAKKGIKVTGIDISKNSLDYAGHYAAEKGLDIDYRLINFFDIDYSGIFDSVIQVNGELNTFSDDKRDELLAKLRKALIPGGHLIFDVMTRVARMKYGLKNGWYASNYGFWRPDKHLVLERGFDYPEDSVWLDQYIVLDSDGVKVYNNWFHDYSLETISPVLEKAGFTAMQIWNDLTGTPYAKGGDWIAIVAKKA